MSKSELQELIDLVAPGGTLKLEPPRREVEGPVVIRKPITIEGQESSVWARKGPVLSIETSDVRLNHLSISITGNEAKLSGEETFAVVIQRGVTVEFDDVAVQGNVRGLDAEEGEWRYPRSLRLGALKAGQSHEFTMRLVAPVACRLRSEIAGLSVQPTNLKAGAGEVKLKIDPLADGTRLRGTITMQTAFLTRRLTLTGNITAREGTKSTVGAGQVIYQPDDWEALVSGVPQGSAAKVEAPSAPATPPVQPDRPAPPEKKPEPEPTQGTEPPVADPPTAKPKRRSKRSKSATGMGKPASPPAVPPRDLPRKATGTRAPDMPDVFESAEQPPGQQGADPPKTPQSPKVESIPMGTLWSPSANTPDRMNSNATESEVEPVGQPATEGASGHSEAPAVSEGKPSGTTDQGEASSDTTPGAQRKPPSRRTRKTKPGTNAFGSPASEPTEGLPGADVAKPTATDSAAVPDPTTASELGTEKTAKKRKKRKIVKSDGIFGFLGKENEDK